MQINLKTKLLLCLAVTGLTVNLTTLAMDGAGAQLTWHEKFNRWRVRQDPNQALFKGITEGNLAKVNLALELRANVNLQLLDQKPVENSTLYTPHQSVKLTESLLTRTIRLHPNRVVIARLLAAGANINVATTYTTTSIVASNRYTHNGISEYNYYESAEKGFGIFAEVKNISELTFELLIRQALTPELRQQALIAAGRLGYVSAIDYLVANGADVTQAVSDRRGNIPKPALLVAACHGQKAAVAALLRHRADVNQAIYIYDNPTVFHGTVLTNAIENYIRTQDTQPHAKLQCLKSLIAAGADINAASYMYSSPLESAIQRDAIAVARLLIEAGADFNKATKSGQTLLMTAESAEATAILLNAGADVTVRDSTGKTALDYATDPVQIRILKSAGAPSNHTAMSTEPGIEMVPLRVRSLRPRQAADGGWHEGKDGR